jgi:Amt family ammonium transporter
MVKKLVYLVSAALIIPAAVFAQDKGAAQVNPGDCAWLLTSSALVLLMTMPGLALFYGGMVRKKNILSTMYYSFAAAVIVSALWVIGQYSLSFGKDIGGIIGSMDKFFFYGITKDSVSGTVPEFVFSAFQMMFAIITVALISGALVERLNFGAWVVFIVLWTLLVYTPLAHWVWGGGWLSKLGDRLGAPGLGTLDFAGGLVVHLSSGISALVAVIYLGRRSDIDREPPRPNSITLTFIGAGLLWFGWFGFNAGSALSSGGQAGSAFMATNTAAAFGAITWMIIEWIRIKKPSVIGGTSGLVAGLATITPAAGFVDIPGAIMIGILAGISTYFFVAVVKKALGYDDSLDAFGIHGISGTFGILLTGLFANPIVGGAAGLFYGKPVQFVIQVIAVLAGIVLSVAGTLIILILIDKVFRIKLRVSAQSEASGLDMALHGESEE